MALPKTKEEIIDGEITMFSYDEEFGHWTATHTEDELRSFVERIQKRARKK